MKEVSEFLKKCGTFYIATIDGDKPTHDYTYPIYNNTEIL